MSASEQRIHIDQVCIGLHIRLEDWLHHPFLFSSFKLRHARQLEILRGLGLEHVIYVPDKSDVSPLPPPSQAAAPAPAATGPDPEVQAMFLAKQARRERLTQQREALGRCEKRFASGVSSVRSLLRNLFARPEEATRQARELVSEMVDTLLTEKDVVLHLMNAKSGDENAYFHALNVTMLALILGREAGLTADELRELGLGTLLHDLGKERVPSRILLKKTPWSTAERNFYQQHVLYGVEMAQRLPNLGPAALEVIAMHHETLDGQGFPGRLTAERIGRYARIACIANTFDNYCNRSNLADSLTPAEAISVMYKREQGKYDPLLMQHFIRVMGVYPPGSVVQLSDGTIGLVMSVNPGALLRPSLLIYDPEVTKDEALWLDLAEDDGLTVSKTLRPAELERAVYDYLEPRSRVSYYTDSTVSTRRTQ